VIAYELGTQQGIDSLVSRERKVPTAGPGQVLVAVKAAALNHRDLMIAESRYGKPKPPERVPLGDGAGEVVAVGAGVTNVKAGDRVTAPHFTRWIDGVYDPAIFEADAGNSMDGWLAEQVVMPAAALVKIPAGLQYDEAAALGAAAITAWTVIHTLGQAKPGDVVLTLGTGGVSILALQIARMFGARVAITSSSDEKLAVARRLGAEITVNYRTTPKWEEAVLAATGGRGVDIVVETVGIATLSQSMACSAPNARIGLLGALARPESPPNLGALIGKNIVLKGITSGSRRMLEDLLRAAEINGVHPVIDRRFPFAQAKDAYRYLAAGEFVGKVVITVP
jgi:NADPH:quinone reductase-like Zn-dependent oxidoreductase